jgi:hypothetical protein
MTGSYKGTGTNEIEGVYVGRILPDSAEFAGKQNHSFNGNRFEGRNCTMTFRRKLA